MQLTFTEMHTPTVGLQIQVDRQLYTEQSDFQRIDVFECCLLYTSPSTDLP